MAAPLRELLVNNVVTTTLDGGIDGSVTTLDVVAGSIFPSTGNFRIRIGNELMLVTTRSTDTLTVVRGIEGTTPTGHANADEVAAILTAGSLGRYSQDRKPLWGYSSAPPLGRLVGTDGITPLVVSDFTWVNQGGATATDENGTILLRVPGASGENCRVLKRTAPSTPWTHTVAFHPFAATSGIGIPNFAIIARQSSSGKFYAAAINTDDGTFPWTWAAYTLASATSFNATEATRANGQTLPIGNAFWLRITDDGTDLTSYISMDGLNWIVLDVHDRDSYMTAGGPDEIGIYGNNHNSFGGYDILGRLVHWSTF